jgi:hypothetical protein
LLKYFFWSCNFKKNSKKIMFPDVSVKKHINFFKTYSTNSPGHPTQKTIFLCLQCLFDFSFQPTRNKKKLPYLLKKSIKPSKISIYRNFFDHKFSTVRWTGFSFSPQFPWKIDKHFSTIAQSICFCENRLKNATPNWSNIHIKKSSLVASSGREAFPLFSFL